MTDQPDDATVQAVLGNAMDRVIGCFVALQAFDYREIARGIRAEILREASPEALTSMGQALRIVEAGAQLQDIVGIVLAEQAEDKAKATRQ